MTYQSHKEDKIDVEDHLPVVNNILEQFIHDVATNHNDNRDTEGHPGVVNN